MTFTEVTDLLAWGIIKWSAILMLAIFVISVIQAIIKVFK